MIQASEEFSLFIKDSKYQSPQALSQYHEQLPIGHNRFTVNSQRTCDPKCET